MILVRRRPTLLALLLCGCALSGCGGGGGVNSTPTPIAAPLLPPVPVPVPVPTPAPTPTDYNTAEYRRSDGPVQHGAITAYQAGASGHGVTVGIIDSGIATGNAEFTGRISAASQDFGGNGSIEDADGHGTAVATVLAAARNDRLILGVAWDANILALRTDSAGSCATQTATDPNSGCRFGTAAIGQALDHARLNGARVVNLSLGGGAITASLAAAVDRATAAGIILVVSSGNDGTAAPDDFAASILNAGRGRGLVIIAGSVDANGVHSSFSDGALGYEQSVLMALGEHVLSQDNIGTQYRYSGTSFSAPQIAGAAALLAQAFPNLTSAQIVNLLLTSATDAGAAGADSVYGRGVLNISRAFAPAGSTSLAGSAIPVSLTSNGVLSPAMGDATGQSAAHTVVLDSLGRAYGLNIDRTIGSATPNLSLAPTLQNRLRTVAMASGPFNITMAIAPTRAGAATSERLSLSQQGADRAHMLSGSIMTRLGRDTTVAVGFAQGGASLIAQMTDRAEPPFLIASSTRSSAGFDQVIGTGLAVQRRIGANLTLTVQAESGRVWQPADDALAIDRFGKGGMDSDRSGDDRRGYATMGIGVVRRAGPWQFSTGLLYLREGGSVLGAHFSPVIGALAGRSLFLDGSTRLDVGDGWAFGASVRQGWSTASGVAGAHARMTSNAWALDAERRGLFDRADRFALRLSQPLRVETGGLALILPTVYDYGTRSATLGRVDLGLAPKGRQIDQEAVYSVPMGPGWLTSNLYWRHERGNLAWFPDEIGGAMRFSMNF